MVALFSQGFPTVTRVATNILSEATFNHNIIKFPSIKNHQWPSRPVSIVKSEIRITKKSPDSILTYTVLMMMMITIILKP